MAKKKAPVQEEAIVLDFKDMSEQDIVDIVCDHLAVLCNQLEQQGTNPELVTAGLFRLFAERMCDSGDRDTYDNVLEMALEDQWEEVTIH
jgi:hypothetical protein